MLQRALKRLPRDSGLAFGRLGALHADATAPPLGPQAFSSILLLFSRVVASSWERSIAIRRIVRRHRVVASVLLAVAACSRSQAPATSSVVCGPGTRQVGNVCVAPQPAGLSCGPGTIQVGGECVPADGSIPDAGPDAGTVVGAPVGEDAGTSDEAGSQATNLGIDAAHHNAQPFDTIASPLTPAWALHLNGTVGSPLIVHGMVIVAANEQPPNLRAVDVKTGALVWGPIPTGTFRTLAYDGGSVFAGDSDGTLSAFDALTGKTSWSKRVPVPSVPVMSAPVASGGIVYVHSPQLSAGTFALDARDGTVLWNVRARISGLGAVAVGGGVVYAAEVCRTLFALDARTGSLNFANLGACVGGGGATPAVYQDAIWERDSADGNIIVGLAGETRAQFATEMMPAFHSGTAFYLGRAESLATALSGVDIATNVIKWSFSGDGGLCTSPVVAGGGGQVFVGSSSGNVYELEEATGKMRSVSNVGALRCWQENMSMSLGAGHLVVPAENAVVAY